MSMSRFHLNESGFTLIELAMVIVIVGILAAVAVQKLSVTVTTARQEQTKKQLDELAYAIAGNPNVYGDGSRSSFGYIGDVGAFPPNLDALAQDPGGYATWKGPYITASSGGRDFRRDAWNVSYVYLDTLLRSSGSGANIDKLISSSRTELLSNTVAGYFIDAGGMAPGSSHAESIWIELIYPDGSGNLRTDSLHPAPSGWFQFGGIPVGNHTLRAIYTPASDTVIVPVTAYPHSKANVEVVFPADLW